MTDPKKAHPEPPEENIPVKEERVQKEIEEKSVEGRPIKPSSRQKGLHAVLAFALVGIVVILFLTGIVGGWLAIGLVAFLLVAYALIGGLPRITADTMRTKEKQEVIREIKEDQEV